MLSGPLCVECSAKVGKLYTEYSEGNVKLTRCEKCGSVADRYIEYELVLVVVDLILHRIQAYRHLLFNREPACSATPAYVQRLFVAVMCLSVVLRLTLLSWLQISNPNGKDLSLEILAVGLKALLVCLLDHLLFVTFAFIVLVGGKRRAVLIGDGVRMRRLYCAMALPEMGKVLAFVLYTWDKEPTLMALIGLIVLSAQHMALTAVTADMGRCLVAVTVALVSRVCFRLIVHTYNDEMVSLGFVV